MNEREKKNRTPITVTLKRFGSAVKKLTVSFEWNGGRIGENELSILITQLCDSLFSA